MVCDHIGSTDDMVARGQEQIYGELRATALRSQRSNFSGILLFNHSKAFTFEYEARLGIYERTNSAIINIVTHGDYKAVQSDKHH
jgi:hypothetical protein